MLIGLGLAICVAALGLLGVDRELLAFPVGVLLVVAGARLSRRSTF